MGGEFNAKDVISIAKTIELYDYFIMTNLG